MLGQLKQCGFLFSIFDLHRDDRVLLDRVVRWCFIHLAPALQNYPGAVRIKTLYFYDCLISACHFFCTELLHKFDYSPFQEFLVIQDEQLN